MFSKKFGIRLLCLLLTVLMLLPMLVACKDDTDTDGDEKDPNADTDKDVIAVNWHLGMVGSASNEDGRNAIVDGKKYYSYSDVIYLEKAGTKITFTDVNEPGSVDTQSAGNQVYVVSHWVKESADSNNFMIAIPGDHYEGKLGRSAEIIAEEKDKEYIKYEYVSTYDNEYIRLCYRSGQTADNTEGFQFAKVTMKRTSDYGTLQKNAKQLEFLTYVNGLIESCYYDVFRNLDIVAIGDSYFDDPAVKDRLWLDLMVYKYGINLDNHGISGSTIANDTRRLPEDHSSYSSGASRASNPMCVRVQDESVKKGFSQTPDPNVDIVFFDGGRNDLTRGISIGAISLENTDPSTICGAINVTIAKLKELYPNALIIGFPCWSAELTYYGQKQSTVSASIVALFKLHNLPCLDTTDKEACGVDVDDKSFRQQYTKNADYSHLNEEGQRMFMPIIEKFTADAYTDFLASKQQ